MPVWCVSLLLALWAGIALADQTDRRLTAGQKKFFVDGDVLIYDTINVPRRSRELLDEDVEVFRALLTANPDVTLVQITSQGGLIRVAHDIGALIEQRGLDTRVDGVCESSCTILFLAGHARSMTAGSSIGFHRFTWDADDIRDVYRDEQEDFGWSTPFDMGAWIFEDTQREMYEHLLYMINRGVDPVFAIQSMQSGSDDMWYPSRLVLAAAGVLRD